MRIIALNCGLCVACDAQAPRENNSAGQDRGLQRPDRAKEIATDLGLSTLDASVDAHREMDYPLDEVIRFNHLQSLGTHNSYHRRPERSIPPWDYDHPPLDEQLDELGVRQFELDLHENEPGIFEVYHIARLDALSSCSPLEDCLNTMRRWSQRHAQHHPLMVLLEVKVTVSTPGEVVETLERILRESWGAERLLKPAALIRDMENLREGLARGGWPTLGESRGQLMVVLHSGGALRESLLSRPLLEWLMFPDAYGNLDAHYAAYHSINDPVEGATRIRAAVEAGHMVRTRADANNVEPRALDHARA
ncbi:MAG: Ca2+-dependent phosphoinositide-specific phospholipase C, partial [Myxococcota bacterium]|nr:Ca2+-dependent phosphoinositide-specific phospholipase C [Myxococcota bacterium]